MKKRISFLMIAAISLMILFGYGTAEPAQAAAKPEIVLTGYSVAEGFTFGEETEIEVSFMNMSEFFTCSSILISYTSANQSVIPSYGHSNQVFIERLESGQSETVTFPVVLNDRGDGYATMTFSIEYAIDNVTSGTTENIKANIKSNIREYITENSEGTILENVTGSLKENLSEDISAYITDKMSESLAKYRMDDIRMFSTSAYIVFPIGDDSVSVRSVNVTTETTIGANSLVSVSFENQLKTDLTNAKLIISGDVNDGVITYQIGNVNAKSTKYAEYYLNFTSLGQKSIKLQLKYTSDKGEEFTKDIGEYIINVREGISQSNSNISLNNDNLQNQAGNSTSLAIIFFGLGGVLLIVAIVVLIVSKFRSKN